MRTSTRAFTRATTATNTLTNSNLKSKFCLGPLRLTYQTVTTSTHRTKIGGVGSTKSYRKHFHRVYDRRSTTMSLLQVGGPLLIHRTRPNRRERGTHISRVPTFRFFHRLACFTFSKGRSGRVPTIIRDVRPVRNAHRVDQGFLVIVRQQRVIRIRQVDTTFCLGGEHTSGRFKGPTNVRHHKASSRPRISPPTRRGPRVTRRGIGIRTTFVHLVRGRNVVLTRVQVVLHFHRGGPVHRRLRTHVRPNFFLGTRLMARRASRITIRFLHRSTKGKDDDRPSKLNTSCSTPHLPNGLRNRFERLNDLAKSHLPRCSGSLILPRYHRGIVPTTKGK